MARDQTLFQDDDGTAYHIYTSEQNSTLHIAKLTEDYLHHSGEFVRAFNRRWMEAAVMFKHGGRYYLFMSGCTGWLPNAARGAWAEHVFGPWTEFGNPCTGTDPETGTGPATTFHAQGATAFRAAGRQWIMLDRWNMKDFIDSRYLWIPVEFHSDGTFALPWIADPDVKG